MAGSRFAYVRNFELPDPLLPGTFMVLRLDGQGFHRFSTIHEFKKPNDERALNLMNHAAKDLMEAFPDAVLGFGESDEYSFLLKRSCALFNRRQSKILSTLTSHFTSSYVFHWSNHFPTITLKYPPTFDGRIVLYPGEKEVKDYFSWRQADTHINNLYNTTFWALVQQGGLSTTDAHARLRGTYSKDKNEILFSQFGINYNNLPAMFRKGSILVRERAVPKVPTNGGTDDHQGGRIDQAGNHNDNGTNSVDQAQQNQQQETEEEIIRADEQVETNELRAISCSLPSPLPPPDSDPLPQSSSLLLLTSSSTPSPGGAPQHEATADVSTTTVEKSGSSPTPNPDRRVPETETAEDGRKTQSAAEYVVGVPEEGVVELNNSGGGGDQLVSSSAKHLPIQAGSGTTANSEHVVAGGNTRTTAGKKGKEKRKGSKREGTSKMGLIGRIEVVHVDLIGELFWDEHGDVLE